ncbi:MAG TPA: DUF5716 family protein [Lachnospiraceae bacterium]|nr:DUF5716 family protein [Lachnospiraceae bacterium]
MLFDVIPAGFFIPLASPNKTVYWDCVCKLFSVTDRQLSFGVERTILVDELQFYFDSAAAAEPASGSEASSPAARQDSLAEDDFSSKDSRDKANFVLRKLESCGWISVDTDNSYVQRVNFRDYAIQVVKTLIGIQNGKKTEYQGYIYTILNLARAKDTHQGLNLIQITENTDALITGLKNLNSNIKRYIDELTQHSTIPEIMDALLNDYYTEVVDKAYHRLRTADNVSKFRPEIIERLENKSRSPAYMNGAAKEIAEMREIDVRDAGEEVQRMLHGVIGAFREMDEILNEIDKKNTRYQRAAINRAKFLLTSSEDIRGQLKEILAGINRKINEENMDFNAIYKLDFMENLVRIYSTEFLDTSSLYSPIEGRKEFKPAALPDTEADEALRALKKQRMEEHLENVLSVSKIENEVLRLLGSRSVIRASELPLTEDLDFIRIIYIRLYAQRKHLRYHVVPGEYIDRAGYHFRDFEIWKN